MKNIFKNRLFIFILGGIVFGSIGVYAATTYSSNLILYKTPDADKPLNEVLDDLYSIKTKGNATSNDILKDKSAIVQGQEIIGTFQPNASQIAKGQTVAGVAGTYTSDANAVAANITKDKTAYVNGVKIIGTGADATAQYNAGFNAGKTGVNFASTTVKATSKYEDGNHNVIVSFSTNIKNKTLWKTIFVLIASGKSGGGGTVVPYNGTTYDPATGVVTTTGWYWETQTITVFYAQ